MLEPQKTPYTSSVAKTSDAKAMLSEVLGDRMRAPRLNGSREGTAGGKGGNKAVKRARFGNYIQKFWRPWMVSDLQEASDPAGTDGEVANSKV
jgi:hypothetical protein